MNAENQKRMRALEEAEQSLKQSRTVLDYLEGAGGDVDKQRRKVEKLQRAVNAAKTALKTID